MRILRSDGGFPGVWRGRRGGLRMKEGPPLVAGPGCLRCYSDVTAGLLVVVLVVSSEELECLLGLLVCEAEDG